MPSQALDASQGSPPARETVTGSMSPTGLAALDKTASLFSAALDPEETKPLKKAPAKAPPPASATEESSDEPVEDPETEPEPSGEEPESTETDDARSETTEDLPPADDASDEADEEPESPALHEVKVRGKIERHTLEELKAGYSRTSDYTQSKMELAEKNKAFDAKATESQGKLAQYDKLLEQAQQMLTDLAPKEPDWEQLRNTMDPAEYAQRYTDWQRFAMSRKELVEERQRVQREAMDTALDTKRKRIEAETGKLIETRPELKDAGKQQQFFTDVFTYAQQQGFSIDQLREVENHQILLILDKARRYEALQSNRPNTTKVITGKLKPASPSGKKPPVRKVDPTQQAADRLRKSGDVRDLADVFLHHAERAGR